MLNMLTHNKDFNMLVLAEMGDVQPSDEHITMLLNMGFTDIDHVREALSLAKNDLNEAVAILTGEVNKGDSLYLIKDVGDRFLNFFQL